MRVNTIQNTPSFKKTLVANTAYLKGGKVCPAKIYSLDPYKDERYFLRLEDSEKWQMNDYIDNVLHNMRNVDMYKENYPHCRSDFFVMEDENKECLAYIAIDTDSISNETNIDYMEVCPEYSSENSNRKTKYIGESLLAFASNFAQKFFRTTLTVNIPSATAVDFYKKEGFVTHPKNICGLYLPNKNVHVLTARAYDKTGVGVSFVD